MYSLVIEVGYGFGIEERRLKNSVSSRYFWRLQRSVIRCKTNIAGLTDGEFIYGRGVTLCVEVVYLALNRLFIVSQNDSTTRWEGGPENN